MYVLGSTRRKGVSRSANTAQDELELVRQVTNLCQQGYYPMAALKIVRIHKTKDVALDFLSSLKGRYINDDLHDELEDLITIFLE